MAAGLATQTLNPLEAVTAGGDTAPGNTCRRATPSAPVSMFWLSSMPWPTPPGKSSTAAGFGWYRLATALLTIGLLAAGRSHRPALAGPEAAERRVTRHRGPAASRAGWRITTTGPPAWWTQKVLTEPKST